MLLPCKSVVVYFLLHVSTHVVIIFNLSDIHITSVWYTLHYTLYTTQYIWYIPNIFIRPLDLTMRNFLQKWFSNQCMSQPRTSIHIQCSLNIDSVRSQCIPITSLKYCCCASLVVGGWWWCCYLYLFILMIDTGLTSSPYNILST